MRQRAVLGGPVYGFKLPLTVKDGLHQLYLDDRLVVGYPALTKQAPNVCQGQG